MVDFQYLRNKFTEAAAEVMTELGPLSDDEEESTFALASAVLIAMGIHGLIAQKKMPPKRILATCLQLLMSESSDGEYVMSVEDAESVLGIDSLDDETTSLPN